MVGLLDKGVEWPKLLGEFEQKIVNDYDQEKAVKGVTSISVA